MVAMELNIPPVEESGELQDFDDAEETLSLCDLPLNSSASDWNYYSKEDHSSSFDQDFFEFCSENFTASTYPTDNIIFCGKLIPYKGATVAEKSQDLDITTKPKNTKKSSIFPWRSQSCKKSTTTSKHALPVPLSENNGYATRKFTNKDDFSTKKASLLVSPMKSRWYLFAFGMARFPVEMELRDIKMRQSKKSPANKLRQETGKEMSNGRREKGLWGLLRFLGCKSHHAHAMVKASFGCMPSVNL